MNLKTKLLTIFALFGLGIAMSACETVEGAGQDIENAGQSIQDAAN
jgi:predicted small secreted protein